MNLRLLNNRSFFFFVQINEGETPLFSVLDNRSNFFVVFHAGEDLSSSCRWLTSRRNSRGFVLDICKDSRQKTVLFFVDIVLPGETDSFFRSLDQQTEDFPSLVIVLLSDDRRIQDNASLPVRS